MTTNISAGSDSGPRSRGLLRLDSPLSPPSTPVEMFAAHVWGAPGGQGGFVLRKICNQSSCHFRQIKKITPKCCPPPILFFCELTPHA